MVFSQIMSAPKQVVSQAMQHPLMFGVGAFAGATVVDQLVSSYVPNQTLLPIDKMTVTATDVGTAAVGGLVAAFGHKIPVVGSMIGETGAKAIGAGIMGGVGYKLIAQEFGLPQIKSVVPRANAGIFGGGQPFSQAYYGGSFKSFSGDISI